MDPQKRTAINQIATHMNYQYILNNIIGAPLLTLTIIYNDIGSISLEILFIDRLSSSNLIVGHELALLILYLTTWMVHLSLFTLMQFTILNLLYIKCWNRMLSINQDFLTMICIQINYVIVAFLVTVRFCTEQHNVNIHYQSTRNLFGLTGPLPDLYPKIRFW